MSSEQVSDWRPVVGYEGIYEVSSDGLIRSLPRTDTKGRPIKGRLMRPSMAGRYPSVPLCKNARRKTSAVHIIVAAAFLGPRPQGMDVAHNDGDVSNARLSNLRYATHKENEADKRSHGTQFIAKGELNGHAKLNAQQVSEIIHRHLVGKESQSALAAEFGVHQSMISHIKRGANWTHIKGDM